MSDCFEQLVRQHQAMVFAYICAIVRDRTLAEDVLQETFLAAYSQLGRLEEVKCVPAWLRGVARNKSFAALRQRNRFAGPAIDVVPEELFATADARDDGLAGVLDALAECRRKLTSQQTRTLELYYDRDLPATEVAGQLGLSDQTVFNTLWIARRELKQCIERRLLREGESAS